MAICHKASTIFDDLIAQAEDDGGEGTSVATPDVKASRGWFDKFHKRTGIHSVVRHGEAASSDTKAAEAFSKTFDEMVIKEGYSSRQVFNCDETSRDSTCSYYVYSPTALEVVFPILIVGYLFQIEGLLDEEDFRLHVKREEFEELCVDVFDRVKGPVDSALISSGMDISAIDQFIIVGGATRIPKIQMMLQDIWGHELGKNINADEAAAMGAVYRAADLGQGFKVKKFHVKEAALFPVEVDFDRQIENEDGSKAIKTVKRSLFALGNGYPQKKVMTFNKHTTDFSFYVNYGDLDHLPKNEKMAADANNITHVIVSGVTSAFQKHLQEGSEPKGIKAHFNMDDSGVLSLGAMEAVFEKSILVEENKPKEEESTLSKLGSTISKLFSGSEDEKLKSNKTEENNEKPHGDGNEKEEKEVTQDERKVEEKVKEETEKELKPKLIMVKEDLNFTVKYLDVLNLSPENLKLSKKKLTDINAAERARNEKAAARNTLESYILDAQEKLWQEEFEKASTEEQRTVVRELCTQVSINFYCMVQSFVEKSDYTSISKISILYFQSMFKSRGWRYN
ncbi:hypoxia up-regulated protein 1-like [Macrobrachium nipponense]|uniref:hypoxia up-regulated protein 1-like n=1 Tax=Macrobrachium nipponense TaxID=159736 RepID=UPI0030C89715